MGPYDAETALPPPLPWTEEDWARWDPRRLAPGGTPWDRGRGRLVCPECQVRFVPGRGCDNLPYCGACLAGCVRNVCVGCNRTWLDRRAVQHCDLCRDRGLVEVRCAACGVAFERRGKRGRPPGKDGRLCLGCRRLHLPGPPPCRYRPVVLRALRSSWYLHRDDEPAFDNVVRAYEDTEWLYGLDGAATWDGGT